MNLSKQQFWKGISILLNNYHAINRKLFACSIIEVQQIVKGLQQLKLNLNGQHEELIKEDIDKSLLISQLLKINNDDIIENNIEGFVVHFKCIPKKGGNSIHAVGIIDLLNTFFRMTFNDNSMTDFEIKLNGELVVNMLNDESGFDVETSLRWSEFVLKPKFYKWCQNDNKPKCEKNTECSLRLIDNEKYNRLYNEFKQKYSESAMKLWNDAKESTDPLKFIYEDLAIAAYLITLWQSDIVNKPPTAFADLGCGNGLLVYILIQEGYQGYGYDVRARKLWSLYPIQITSRLYEQAVEPFKFNLPPEVDWLIGNHSDELSPWLPVLAATCHRNVSYFLLPCCAFEFSGNKFQRRNSSISGYKDFCNYAEQISNTCGFKTEKDRLKIPSTKRIALIGLSRMYTDNDHMAKMEHIKQFVKNEQQQHPNSSLEEIKLRGKEEAVRNCTQIEKSIIENLVKKIFILLLEESSNKEETIPIDEWQTGGRLTMSQIAKSLDKENLKQIKSECGGLKTLLRNKHEIFQFQEPDFVLIRKPQQQAHNTNKPQTVKKRACFFKLHHPQGCPLSDDECTFVH
ncbi:probable tRNA (uracil-O(2)-)-methyltransferase isoform X1 [Lucilia cuprina]|uniref:probable tRNA (uracil-O(2)-)-methyltransferase isoform X1 n=2 Tax=Lucilia cuprina TaxID=7375 RepID=UPI001F05EC2F|nr:probable tRNA (uracil-O(2)-)-methyltransferase isoform X1 [Lucilia cuprina]